MNKQEASVVFLTSGFFLGPDALANNGDQMVGFSGISNAMGGAVVALPQDVTTSLSNPAGLAFLKLGETRTRFDMNLSVLEPTRVLNGVESDNGAYVMATGGFAFRSSLLSDRFTIGVGAYPISGGGVDFPNEAFSMPVCDPAPPDCTTADFSIVASRQSLRIGPAMAYRVNNALAVGANLSLTSNQMSLQGPGRNFPNDVAYGLAWVVGATYKPAPVWTLGWAYTSRSHSEDLKWNTNEGTFTLSFEDPQTVALGIGFEPTPWQIEADVKWIDYSSVRERNILNGPDGDEVIAYGWDDQIVYALGIRYAPEGRYALMAGYNYGESPLGPEDVNNNIGATAIVEEHLSAGLSVRMTHFSTLTFSWIHGFENSLTASVGLPTEASFETDLYTLQFTYQN